MATNPITSDKAQKHSVSFSPGSLADWASEYGESQVPVMSFSAVVCTGLAEFKRRVAPSDSKEAQVLAAARKVGLEPALKVLAKHVAKQKRNHGHSEG
jgi:hypothetical protein